MKTLQTVNVIEENDGTVLALYSFPDTPEGVEAAENLFVKLALENGADMEEMDDALDNGRWWDEEEMEWTVLIVHSNPVE